MNLKLKISVKRFTSFLVLTIGFIVSPFFVHSCGGSDDISSSPSNINLSIIVQGANINNPNGDGSGIISCVATANNAVRYVFKFDGGSLIESIDGTLEHTFTKKGINTYAVLVFAYSSSGESINVTQSVSVFQSDTSDTLVFSDEFDQDGAADSSKWLFETIPPNNGSWWNGEKQHYTDRLDNTYVSNGTLKIVAKKEKYTFAGSTKNYTSARLNSKFSFTYGRIEVKAKLPRGEGTWPAIWTLGSNISTVGWPACGEIDIMEHWGHNPRIVSSAIHTTACSGVSNCQDAKIGEKIVEDYDSAFHLYSAEWTPESIKFYLDNQLLYTYNPTIKTSDNWPFTKNQFILLNIALGADWFNIDPNFDQSVMEIDYIRIYQ